VDEFRFGVAETYDVIVTPQADRAYTLVAESIDRSGFALGTLAPHAGMIGPVPEPRARALLTMADMPHITETNTAAEMAHAAMGHVMPDAGSDYVTGVPGSGWVQTGAPADASILAYTDLRYLQTQTDVRPPARDIEIRLGGNMNRYLWTLNGKKYSQDPAPINLRFGERVRLKFVNDTMMAHPMHLHGMFVQLENGQPANKLPNKHTVIIAPGDSYSVLLTADEPGEWAIHCHLQFHSMAGMMGKVIVAVADDNEMTGTGSKTPSLPDTGVKQEEHQHVH
jgi:FtsP/CotA-like multicopper oxidase with cupredoxin domain